MINYEQDINIRWSDLDVNGHVRHSVYYDYGAQVRIAFLQQQGVGIDWLFERGIGPVLFREEAHFYRELRASYTLRIDMMLSGASADHRKWSMRHRILRGDDLCATIDIDGAWLDLNRRRIMKPPRELFERFENLSHTEDFREI